MLNKSNQFDVKANVRLTMIDKFGNKYDEVIGSNRVTKLALMGLIKFINGEFNPTLPDFVTQTNNYIPSYIAFGSNIQTELGNDVSSSVTVTDYKLLNEYRDSNSQYMRFPIGSSNTIQNIQNNPYIKLILRCYISSETLNNKPINEVGLFTTEKGNSCWARIVLPKSVIKTEGSVVDVTWELTIVSIESQNSKYDEYSDAKKELYEKILESNKYTSNNYEKDAWDKFNDIDRGYANAVLYYSSATDKLIIDECERFDNAITELLKHKID